MFQSEVTENITRCRPFPIEPWHDPESIRAGYEEYGPTSQEPICSWQNPSNSYGRIKPQSAIPKGIFDTLSQMHDEMRSIKRELKDLQSLKARLECGDVILLVQNQATSEGFSAKDIEDCETLILTEIKNKHQMYPSDLAEQYGIDIELAMACFDKLAKEGKIVEL